MKMILKTGLFFVFLMSLLQILPQSGGRSANASEISYQIYIPLAARQSPWQEVGTNSASGSGIGAPYSESWSPMIAIGSDGTPYVAWEEGLGNYKIYLRGWDGAVWGEVGTGSASGGGVSNNTGDSFDPEIAVSPTGQVYLAWLNVDTGGLEIYVKRWNGSIWEEVGGGSASGGGISNSTGNASAPSITVTPGGIPYIAWEDNSSGNYEIYVLRWNGSVWVEAGSNSAGGGGISNTSGNSRNPVVATAPDGSVYAAWEDLSDGDSEIYVRRWNGSSWVEVGSNSAGGGGISMNAGESKNPVIAVAPSGRPFVFWDDDSSGETEIYGMRWNGSGWLQVGAGSASGGGISNNDWFSRFPDAAFAPDGTLFVTWEDYSTGPSGDYGAPDIYVLHWDGITWSEAGEGSASGGGISNDAEVSMNPRIAFDPDGIPYVTWSCNTLTGSLIYLRRYID